MASAHGSIAISLTPQELEGGFWARILTVVPSLAHYRRSTW